MLLTSYQNHEKMHKNKKGLHNGIMKLNSSSGSNYTSSSEEEEKTLKISNDYSKLGEALNTFYQNQ